CDRRMIEDRSGMTFFSRNFARRADSSDGSGRAWAALRAAAKHVRDDDQAEEDTETRRRSRRSDRDNDPRGRGTPAPPRRRLFGVVFLMLLVALLFMMFNAKARMEQITLADFEKFYNASQIMPDSVEVRDDAVIAVEKLRDGTAGKRFWIPLNAPTQQSVADK